MSTRTERVFAAFQGPVLSVGTAVVHMYRAYTVELLLPRRWRRSRSLHPSDVLAALVRATVRAQASLLSPPLRCASCGDVVVLGSPGRSCEGLPDDLECYSATLRSKCTSSKRHLRSPAVVLAVDVGGVLVCSEPFAVFSREPGRQTPSGRASRSLCHAQSCLVVSVEIMTLTSNAQAPPSALGMIPGVADALRQYAKNIVRNCVDRDMTDFVQVLARLSNC
eukprot:m51a1_g4458 hypothetical protein (222) ;mRNA; r:181465-182466